MIQLPRSLRPLLALAPILLAGCAATDDRPTLREELREPPVFLTDGDDDRSMGETAPGAPSAVDVAQAPPAARDPRSLRITDANGAELSWADLVDRAANADVVLLGEVHGEPTVLAAERLLAEDLFGRLPGSFALSMEFLERDQQVQLDDLRTGVRTPDEATALRSLPDEHRRMVVGLAERGGPVIAANAPRRYVTLARTAGADAIADLTAAQRSLVVVPDTLTGGDYEARFRALMASMMAEHAPDVASERKRPGEGDDAEGRASQRNIDRAASAMITDYYLAQNIWDATMADSVARAYRAGHRPVLQVVGQFHTDHEGGLTERVRALLPGASILTITFAGPPSPMDAFMPPPSAPRADLVVHLGDD